MTWTWEDGGFVAEGKFYIFKIKKVKEGWYMLYLCEQGGRGQKDYYLNKGINEIMQYCWLKDNRIWF